MPCQSCHPYLGMWDGSIARCNMPRTERAFIPMIAVVCEPRGRRRGSGVE